jgi:hypothetical protein
MKLRMKKMPRPFALIGDADYELGRIVDGREGELDGHELGRMFAVAVLDRVDDRLAHGNADPVDRVFVEGRHLSHAIAEDLDEVQHVEQAGNLQPDESAVHCHGRVRIIQ